MPKKIGRPKIDDSLKKPVKKKEIEPKQIESKVELVKNGILCYEEKSSLTAEYQIVGGHMEKEGLEIALYLYAGIVVDIAEAFKTYPKQIYREIDRHNLRKELAEARGYIADICESNVLKMARGTLHKYDPFFGKVFAIPPSLKANALLMKGNSERYKDQSKIEHTLNNEVKHVELGLPNNGTNKDSNGSKT